MVKFEFYNTCYLCTWHRIFLRCLCSFSHFGYFAFY